MTLFHRLLMIVGIGVILSGCGTMFNTKPRLEIVGAKNVIVQDMEGNVLPTYADEREHGVFPDRKHTDSVRITYATKSKVVAVERELDGLECLNILSAGLGFVLDDLTNTWFNFAPIYVSVDTMPGKGLERLSVWTANRFGELRGDRDLHLMLVFGPAISFESNGIAPFRSGSSLFPVTAWQAGIGFDYAKEFEAFYLARLEPSFPLSNANSPETADITSHDMYLRYFVSKSYFLQGVAGVTTATGDFIYYDNYYTYNSTVFSQIPKTSTFAEAGLGVGWSGDLSYISLQYLQSLSPFDLGHSRNIRYHTVYLNFGLNLKL